MHRFKMGVVVALAAVFALVDVTPAAAEPGGPVRIVALGDSLTAGLGVAPADAFPAQLERALKARGHDVVIENAGVSGDTTAAGLERFDWAVPAGSEGIILALGANDALRGIPPAETRRNMEALLTRVRLLGVPALVLGMRALRNWGDDYVRAFDGIFPDVAKAYSAEFYPFMLDGVALERQLNQADGLHPNAAGVGVIVAGVLPHAEALIQRIKARRLATAKQGG